MDEVGRFFARFDPFGHKKHRDSHPEPSHDDKDGSKRLPTLYIPVPLGIIKPVSTNPPPPPPPGVGASTVLLANDTLAVNATAMASIMTADSTTRINTTAAVPTVDEAQLQGRRRRRHLLRGSDDGGKDDDAGAMPMTGTGEDDPHHGSFGLGQRLARTEEVEMLRHEQLWALPSETQKAAKPKVVGEAYERISSQSVIFLGPDADADADGAEAVAGGKAMGDSDGEAAVAAVAAEEDRAIDHERGRQLLLHHWHGHGGRADDFDDDDFDDYDDEYESEAQPAYYSKDGGDWYWQTHGFRRLQEAGEGMGMDGDDASSGAPGALMIDADDPETSVPSKRRPSAAEVLAMTPEEQAALRERDRESLENLLRKASREEEAHRSEPNVAKSLDSVLAALAMRPPADTIAESDEDTSIDDIPRRGLQAAAAGAGGQRTAALVSAMAGAISEQQKAEIRQAVYDAAVSMVREAAREVMQEASNSRGASSNSNSNSNKARAGSVGRGGGFGNGGNEDAYQAAANAILNVMARNNNNQPAMRSAVIEGVEERAGGAATAVAASRATESQGRAIDTGRGKSLLEAARAAARQSASAGRPPAGYDPYPPHRHQRRRLRGLKDATFRVPVPFTRDPSSNASNPKLVYNASDAIFINLSAREDEDGALQVTAQSMQGVGNNGDARQIPWPRIGGIGPALNGLGSNSNSGADPEGKGHTKHAWADALLKLVHKHQAGKHPSSTAAEPHASRLLEEAGAPQQPQQAQQAPAKAPEAAAPAPEPAKQPTTVGDFLQNINTKAGADGGTSAAAAGGGGSSGGGGGGGGGLDLNALAGILQRPFVPPVPGAMGTKPGETQQQPGTVDAFGNTIDEPQPAHQQGAQAPTSMMGEQEQEQEAYEEEEEEDEGDSFEPMGLGDAFYDRAASQLLSHSGSNFKKMQAVVQGIMADEGFDV